MNVGVADVGCLFYIITYKVDICLFYYYFINFNINIYLFPNLLDFL